LEEALGDDYHPLKVGELLKVEEEHDEQQSNV
jgi:hypothetical protein